jgi:hypothetical protein
MDPETGIFGSSDAVPETTCLCYHFRYTFRSTYSVADMNHFQNLTFSRVKGVWRVECWSDTIISFAV